MQNFIAVIGFLFIFSSCSNHSKNDLTIFKATEEGFSSANERITWQTGILYKSLENKLAEPRTHEMATVWQPKAEYIKQLSSDITTYIDSLKSDLIKEAGFKKENDKKVYREDDMGAVTRLFSEKKRGKELYEKLLKYKEDMLAVSERIKNEFGNSMVLVTKSFDAATGQQENFTKIFFTDIPLIAALAMLNKLENNVKIIENDFVTYCHSCIADDFHGYDRFSVIIGQRSSYVKGGDEIELTTGVGSFSTQAQPVFFVRGVEVWPDDNGVAVYKFKSPMKAGKYSVPVKIIYTKPDGTKDTVFKTLSYTVAE